MNAFFNSIGELFNLLGRIGTEEYRGVKNTLLYLLITFYSLCFIQWFFDSHGAIRLIGYFFCIGSMLLLFQVPSLIRIAGLGEVLETFRLTQQNPADANNAIPDILENQLVSSIWNMTEKLFFLHSMSCLLIPVLPIKNNPEIIPVFTIAAVAIFLFIWKTGGNWVRPIGLIVSLLFLAIHLSFLFPQPKFYFNELSEKIPVSMIPSGPARIANEVDNLRKIQRATAVEETYKKALAWQVANPGRDLPDNLKKEIEAAKRGLTVSEYESISEKKISDQSASRDHHGDSGNRLIDTVRIDQPPFGRQLAGYLPAGEYEIKFDPAKAEAGATLQILLPDGSEESREINNNLVSVKGGEKGFGIKTSSVAIARIYAQ